MKLCKSDLDKKHLWNEAKIALPKFNIEEMVTKTKEKPTWIHFGAGNIFRGFIATLQQELLDSHQVESGIVAVEAYDYQIIDRIYKPSDDLSLLVLMKSDGTLDKKVIASVGESLVGDTSRKDDWERLRSIFTESSLQIVSFTITEKGYAIKDSRGEYLPIIKKDIHDGIGNPEHVMSKITALAYGRYLNGKLPVAFVSMDNCSHNGEILQGSIMAIAQRWVENGFIEEGFLDYLNNPEKVTFPWTMIDKITPRPSEMVKGQLEKIGFEDTEIICTDKKTYISPFVNAEVPQYLVVEDKFPNGRPTLERAGVIFTDRKTVERVENMKVCTCLNPLHTALAVSGCLLGYNLISEEMNDYTLKRLVEEIGYHEGMPVVVNPGIIEPLSFIKQVIEERLPNPFIPDTPQRIATDTSQKLGIRFGETIKAYNNHRLYRTDDLRFIPLVIAIWCRYLMGVDDQDEKMELSSDPMMEELKQYIDNIKLGHVESVGLNLHPILSDCKIFGINLYDVGLAEKIEAYFKELIAEKGAVRKTLDKYLK
jgi:fructuronate reductase